MKTRYRFSHQASGRYYWYATTRPLGESRVLQVSCLASWFWGASISLRERGFRALQCADRGHPPDPIHIGGPGPLTSPCRCGEYLWDPHRTKPRFERTAPKPKEEPSP